MDLVLFQDAMTQLVRISRILYMPRGHALLIGVGGSGKQSLTRLASFIAGYQTQQITLTRSYNVNNLLDDFKLLYRTAGLKGRGITFLFTDQEIKDEAFLEYMNNVLASGVIANLFARDEMDEICQDLIPIMKKEFPRRAPTNENLLAYFYSRTRQNLHVSLCFSPIGEKFRRRALKFPGLFSGCTIVWFHRWPKEALVAVADHYLSEFPIVCSAAVRRELIHTMGIVHDGVAESCVEYFSRYRRQTHVTPKSYLSFLVSYKTVYKQQHSHFASQAQRMDSGLKKLTEAQGNVVELSKELAVKEKELEVANKEAERVLETVTVQQRASTEIRNRVQVVKDKAQAIVDEIDRDRAVAEAKLEAAKPALQEAADALNTIKPADIATVRRLGKPPNLIMRIMDCVLILFQRHVDSYQPDMERQCPRPSWSESLKFMTNTGFLTMLMTFPKDLINGETVELLEPYLTMEDYNWEVAKKVCGNVAGLLSWTRAMACFYSINKEVLPLKDNLVKQEARLTKANADLQAAQAILDEKERELAKVQAVYEEALLKRQALLDDADQCRRKMNAASILIGSLADEQVRWTEQSKSFKEHIDFLVGDVLVATAFLSYCGPFNQDFRQSMIITWQREVRIRKVPGSAMVNLLTMLTDQTQIGEWNLQGLPKDELSIQNGIIVDQASRYPLLIDPQGQGRSWIQNREKARDLICTTLGNKYFRQHLEDALSQGRPLLIEDAGEELDPVLDNVLERNFIKQGSMFKVKIGDKEVDVLTGFKLYITTKMANPCYAPEVSARTSVIDFTVTIKGLEEQLLGRVILSERQELESQRVSLMEDVQTNKKRIKELEDSLLLRLASVQGSLVDDVDLINVLNTTKTTAADVSRKLEKASETEIQITAAREEYRPIATRGSVLYFLIVEMSMVNCMYQTSLRQFLNLFDISLSKAEKSPVTPKRISNVIECMTYGVWKYVVRGLYEVDKPTFSLLLALKIEMQASRIRHEEFQVFIKGGASLDLNTVKPKPFKWITDMTWLHLVALSNLNQFATILDQVQQNERGWRQWFDKPTPETGVIPDGYQGSLDTFRRLLLVRAWCPDRIMNQATVFVTNTLGQRYAEGFVLDIEGVYLESTPRWPMVGLLSMGSDPTTQIDTLAKKYRVECRTISMGQGQEVHARKLLSQFLSGGGWVLLQNCHLSLAYLDEVLNQLTDSEHVHEEFRLWVTTEVNVHFPITFLQTAIKFTNEPPQGVKASLKRTYSSFTQDYLDINTLVYWKPMMFAVTFLHTTVQERRQYGPLGWNIPYEFNTADLNASLQFVQNHLDDLDAKKTIEWKCVRYMLGEIQYGGRVTDDFDQRLLNTYCQSWFHEGLFSPDFRFATGFPVPQFTKLSEILTWINELPNTDTPNIFGLHENANISYQSKKAKQILDCILNIQPKDASAGEGGGTREDVVRQMAEDMLDKLPPDYVAFEVTERLNQMGALQPMNIFLRQELERIQRLLSTVRVCLTDLKLAIDGTIVMSESLREALDCMYDARIPASWTKLSWDSSTLGFWFTELIERNHQFSDWLRNGRPICFWMTGFFNQQSFLTAIRQEVTRNHPGWALDTVVLWNEVTKYMHDDCTRPPTEGAYVYGLFIEGADFDRRSMRLSEAKPKILYASMPVIHILAIDISKDKTIPRDMLVNQYSCPVYRKPRRTDLTYIGSLYLRCPSTKPPEHWILRGTALLCDIR
ncbi:Dynein heavy chain 5 axonemal [Fasciola gigantica]|uniref:Dynein heavy chain 5 axonemal n=1 Tax=Fasciola gigantica TaxID=46835 RepID=A0A504YVZ4_FASGI|nr:Dynein heavy chain 5 axonemal [Fasciola gigantica]